jgi:hypothetical protein
MLAGGPGDIVASADRTVHQHFLSPRFEKSAPQHLFPKYEVFRGRVDNYLRSGPTVGLSYDHS